MTVIRPFEYKELKPKRSKYGNRKVEYGGERFDSVLEQDRHIFLSGEQQLGTITNLERQVEYRLEVNGILVCKMRLDHRYHVPGRGTVTEDSKGRVTADWRIKQKLFEALFHKKIHIVTKHNLTSLPCL